MRPRIALLITTVLPLVPSLARADSDGYYCAAPGYLAWETRFRPDPARHVLHVVTFSRAAGLVRREPIPLDDFQVHGMRCGNGVIELEGWSTRYSVDISDPAGAVVEQRPITTRTLPAPANLGLWAAPAVIDLESDAAKGEFQLVITRTPRPVTGGVEHYVFTLLVRREPGPGPARIVASLSVFAGILLETID